MSENYLAMIYRFGATRVPLDNNSPEGPMITYRSHRRGRQSITHLEGRGKHVSKVWGR